MKGRIHSLETFGTVDGPGIRFVLFMQGCALQCAYCHNPDTWDTTGAGWQATVEDIVAEIEPYVPYYMNSGGGLTVSGGEPTLQAPFVAALFREVKRRFGMHTALDSSGFCDPEHAKELLDATDLVLLDLKMMDPAGHAKLTSQPNDRILKFAEHLKRIGKPIWVRRVVVPGLTDGPDEMRALGAYLATLPNVTNVELLPYHRYGVSKWKELGRAYPLEGVPEATEQDVEIARKYLEEGRGSPWPQSKPQQPRTVMS
ncbi:pyruvate formate lyase-activating protein [Paenibacillus antri]|uniref:Pyruvate formate-lyase-activating enzyme n=1 Tax=Paenibacillus antri TaxID=2582848 RepID=A0A5R9G7T0_9BACL|nr:pyruvate formate-lyase-activating protein [Paenibacillus antri]TLS50436.1 pyruvate formate lyase-activating protein [Paenibacillus antri]